MQAGQRINGPSAQAADFLRQRWSEPFETAIITGSGFTYEPRSGNVEDILPYRSVPGMPSGSVEGHAHEFRAVRIGSKRHLLCSGRFHLYEGHGLDASLVLVNIAHHLGISRAVIMNAVGALNPGLSVGQVVTPTDLFTIFLPPGTADIMSGVASERNLRWQNLSIQRCLQHALVLTPACYVQVLGPSYETRAEVRMLRRMGADIVGMSTATEVDRAHRLGMQTVILSLVTNVLTDSPGNGVAHSEVIEAALGASGRLSQIIELCVA